MILQQMMTTNFMIFYYGFNFDRKFTYTFQSFSGKSSNDFLSTKTENDGLFNVILTYFKTMKNCLGISVIKRKNKICFTIRCDQL